MAIYLALHPGAVPRVAHRAVPADPPRSRARRARRLADSLRAYIVGQLLAMTSSAALTAIGLYAARRSVLR